MLRLLSLGSLGTIAGIISSLTSAQPLGVTVQNATQAFLQDGRARVLGVSIERFAQDVIMPPISDQSSGGFGVGGQERRSEGPREPMRPLEEIRRGSMPETRPDRPQMPQAPENQPRENREPREPQTGTDRGRFSEPMRPEGFQENRFPENRPEGDRLRGPEDRATNDRREQPRGDERGNSGSDQDRRQQDEEQENRRQQQDEERETKMQEQRLKEMQRGIKQFKSMIASLEKSFAKSGAMSDALKEKIARAKELVASVENAKDAGEIDDNIMQEMGDLMQEINEERQNVQRLAGFRQNIGNMERGIKDFERQLARLQKQKVAIPTDVQETLGKIKKIVETVKTAKTWDEVESAGVEEIGELMDELNQSRQTLEMLARWPQTLKQMDRELANISKQVKRAKSLVDRLMKKEIDLTENLSRFTAMGEKLKTVRQEAVAKMAAGDSEEAFNLVEDDFFGQMEEVWQDMKVIDMMSNLGSFTSQFKRGLNQGKQEISRLKKKKIDVTELQTMLDEIKSKGDDVLALLKAKPIDEDAILSVIQELETMRVTFENKTEELGGGEPNDMPWEQGPDQFKAIQSPQEFKDFIPKK